MVKKQSKKHSLDNNGHGWHIYIFLKKKVKTVNWETNYAFNDLSNLTY